MKDFVETEIPAKEDRNKSLIHYMKKAGYITGHSSSFCGPLSLSFDEEFYKYFIDEPFDHEGLTFSCDPTYFTLGLTTGPYAIFPKCLYG